MSAAADAATTPRHCDIIMKGGITSGVVYPAAVCEIAKDFVFKNVGGTSAGAIAAALTAAAERQRALSGATSGFDRLAAVPDYLASENHLYRLFAPNRSTRALFRTLSGLSERSRFQPAWLAKWIGLVWAYPLAALAGAIVGGIFQTLVVSQRADSFAWAVELGASVVAIVVGITIAIAIALTRDLLTRLPANNFGMVKGMGDPDRTNANALCTWLTGELERTAGLVPGDAPLTFGMLWDAKRAIRRENEDDPPPAKPEDPDVNLAVITTNVTWGRPYQFPSEKMFYYDPEELKQYFPDHVVTWMTKYPRHPKPKSGEAERFAAYKLQGKFPLPAAADLPVIVATRMSLAFPVLLSAVPLYVEDFNEKAPPNGLRPLKTCWFSDGGISSNFPVTLFDSPLPRWPTFAIDLGAFTKEHPRRPNEADNVYMPASNDAGLLPTFADVTGVPAFVSAILDSMQNWNDNTQAHLPGYRDRVVTVCLDPKTEGGLNLDMPPNVLRDLALRGAAAGRLIAGRFRDPSTLPEQPGRMNWENQRWVRYRTAMGSLKTYLSAFTRSMRSPEPPDVSYYDLINATQGTPVHHYELPPADRPAASALTQDIESAGDAIAALGALDADLPKPPPRLVQRPSLES